MKLKIKLLFLSISFFSVNQVSAQLDNNSGNQEKGKIKAIVLNSSKEVKKPTSLNNNNTNGFKDAYNKENEKLKKQQAENNLNNKGILTKAKLSEERFLKAFKKINGQYIYPKIDQDLGSFRSNSKSVNIICRDFQYPDGDRVTIFINDIPIIHNITLRQSYQKFNIPLEIGINKIAFKALNQGSSGPNTAAFKVYNDAGMLLSSNEWNLATGAKATIVISKDK
ncbi:hypothetical protein [Polaribacter sp. Hel1_85]|uniref:hypothetical protein n=1 Tax=Polaribacter sp. Hel1_85 TaxID=1250005 RepID=UPI00052D8CEF|nr:hypothetical protein [Polaribacter sp. Hel1_85]KGL64255.1 hypothetical protein PHEL85_1308 [Polaribacter sp. Hel1_85]